MGMGPWPRAYSLCKTGQRIVSTLAESNGSDDILTQSFGMERSHGVCRSDVRSNHRRARSPRKEGCLPETWTPVGYGGAALRYPFIPYVSRQRGLPQMELSMAAKSSMPRTGARWLGGRYLSRLRLMQVSLSNRSARHSVSFPLWIYLRRWRGYKIPRLASSRCVDLVINHHSHHTWPHRALTNSSYASSPNGPTGHRVLPNYFR